MKKRILFIALAVVLALSVGLIGCTGQQEEEEEEEEPTQEITLDFVTFWPSVDRCRGPCCRQHRLYVDHYRYRAIASGFHMERCSGRNVRYRGKRSGLYSRYYAFVGRSGVPGRGRHLQKERIDDVDDTSGPV